jgi:hypothetical protein
VILDWEAIMEQGKEGVMEADAMGGVDLLLEGREPTVQSLS